MAALATRTGSLLNYADLARDLGITGKTVKAWISILEASGQIPLRCHGHAVATGPTEAITRRIGAT